jgi:acyl-CoA reductase-like NAD-dependent aldehyde dehydrogenase
MALTPQPALPVLEHLIGDERVAGGRQMAVYDPSSGLVVAEQAVATEADVDRAVAAATRAFAGWRRSAPSERARLLLQLADAMDAEAETFARLESLDVGKPISTARAEMDFHSDPLRFFAGATRVFHGTSSADVAPGVHSRVEREPIGVVGLIIPWNFPLLEAVWKIGPALAAGNTLVLKVTGLTPLATTRLFELAAEIFPVGVVNLILGDSVGGKALVAHPGIGLVSLTGATATGRQVAASASGNLKRVHLELGGKAPVLVHADADIRQAAVDLVATGFANSGQDCTAACRIIVHEAAYEEFVAAYVEAAREIVVGPGLDEATTMGPVVSSTHRDSVQGFIDRAARSATVAYQGEVPTGDGFFVRPTVFVDVAQDSEIVQDEVFGPVVTVQRATDEEQMLEWANDSPYGLAASVWTSDINISSRATRALNFGTVWVNTHMQIFPEAPFGGFGESGYGKELSTMAIDDYSRFKHIVTKFD